MNKIKFGRVTTIFLLILALNNSINIFAEKNPIKDFILYVGIFILFAIFTTLISKKYDRQFHAILFTVFGILTQILTSDGNAMAVMFFCFSAYLYGKRIHLITIAGIMIVSLFAKAIINQISPNHVVSLLILQSYIAVIYYFLIHPKPIKPGKVEGFTEIENKIFQCIIDGKSSKEIPDIIDEPIQPVTVRLKIAKMRKKTDSNSNEQMVAKILSKKIDRN